MVELTPQLISKQSTRSLVNIVVGITLWLVAGLLSWFNIINLTVVQLFILLAIYVYIPQLHASLYDFNYWVMTAVSGLLVTVSFQFEQGLLSSLFILLWIVGNIRFFFRIYTRPHDVTDWLHLSSHIFLVAAPIALVLSRLGLQPLDFSHEIIELTAIHFHYAGIMIPAFVAKLFQDNQTPLTKTLSWLIVVGTPVVALGITIGQFFPQIGVFAVLTFAVPLVVISILVFGITSNSFLRLAHVLLIVAMLLAIYYAIGVSFPISTISIPQMISTHGIINGGGFVPLSLIGWARLPFQHNQ